MMSQKRKLLSCVQLCDSMDCSLPGSSVQGIFQARVLEWVAISFSNAWKWKVKVKLLSHAWLLATPWTAAYQAPPSREFSRQEYWSGVPLPSPKHILVLMILSCFFALYSSLLFFQIHFRNDSRKLSTVSKYTCITMCVEFLLLFTLRAFLSCTTNFFLVFSVIFSVLNKISL